MRTGADDPDPIVIYELVYVCDEEYERRLSDVRQLGLGTQLRIRRREIAGSSSDDRPHGLHVDAVGTGEILLEATCLVSLHQLTLLLG